MRNLGRLGSFTAIVMSLLALILTRPALSSADDTNVVKWHQIIGQAAPGSSIGGIQPFGPWSAQDGKAWVHLETGHMKFDVKGLVLANSTSLAVVGTIGVTTQVKGTLVCNGLATGTSAFVDTPPVPLDPQGNASFIGHVAIPTNCLVAPDKLAFVIRIAAAGNPSIVDHWIAAGVVRTP